MISSATASGGPPPPSAHLYLAQLSEDDPRLALEHYQAGINILFAKLKGKLPAISGLGESESDDVLKKNIVRALIAMVEIWMAPTYDLWYGMDLCTPFCGR